MNKNLIAVINAVNLEPITYKLVYSSDGPQWPLEKALYIEKWYRRFLILHILEPQKIVVPTKDIDTYWHNHMLDSIKYHQDCDQLFGYYLHHFPYLGMRGEEDKNELERLFKMTLSAFKKLFGAMPTKYNTKIGSGICGGGDCFSKCGNDIHNDNARPKFAGIYEPQHA